MNKKCWHLLIKKGFLLEKNNNIVIYQLEDGKTKIDVKSDDETVWWAIYKRRSTICNRTFGWLIFDIFGRLLSLLFEW